MSSQRIILSFLVYKICDNFVNQYHLVFLGRTIICYIARTLKSCHVHLDTYRMSKLLEYLMEHVYLLFKVVNIAGHAKIWLDMNGSFCHLNFYSLFLAWDVKCCYYFILVMSFCHVTVTFFSLWLNLFHLEQILLLNMNNEIVTAFIIISLPHFTL